MIPDWLLPNAAEIRTEADVRPYQVFSLVPDETVSDVMIAAQEEARLAALVASHIQTQAVWTWGELASHSRAIPFPLTPDVLAAAYPLPIVAPALVPDPGAVAAQNASSALIIENQQATAQLIVRNLVIAKLYYSINGEEAKERAKNYFITAHKLLSSAKAVITKARHAWQANSFDPFF